MVSQGTILHIIILTCMQIYISTACTVNATATNYGGRYAHERRWEVQDPNKNVIASGKGGDTKTFCFENGGTYTVVGWDTYGDGWNSGKLKIEGTTNGKVYLAPWNGPTSSDKKLKVTTTFEAGCRAGEYLFNHTCQNCPPGKYGTIGFYNSTISCPYTNSNCPAGYYCPGTGGTAATKCPIGKFGNVVGQVNVENACPHRCAAGKYGVAGKTSEMEACINCPAGSYCNGNGSQILCPLGKYGANISKQSNLSSACAFLCEGGTYGTSRGQISSANACTNCAKGRYSATLGAIGNCASKCPAGKKGVAEGKTNETDGCQTCSNGKYQDGAGKIYCKYCDRGTFHTENMTKLNCSICAANTYQDEKGKSSCKSCPNGRFTLVVTPASKAAHDTTIKCVLLPNIKVCPFNDFDDKFILNETCSIFDKTFYIKKNVRIIGYGDNVTIISPGFGRIFQIQNGKMLSLENITLTARRDDNCNAKSEDYSCNNGGVLVGKNATFVAKRTTFKLNQHLVGSAIYGKENSTIRLDQSLFHHNYAAKNGAVVYLEKKSTLVMDDCECFENRLLDGGYSSSPARGTVIYSEDYAHLLITNSSFEKHQRVSSYGDGGVLYSGKFANISFINCNFNENDANQGGVAFVDEWSNVTFTNCIFKQNEAKSKGSVIYLKSNGNIEFHECVAYENILTVTSSYYYGYYGTTSAGDGSVLYSEGPGSVVVSNCYFHNNTADSGCFYLASIAISVSVVNTQFIHNKAYSNGGAIYRTSGFSSGPAKLVHIKNCTFANNVADKGGAIFIKRARNTSISNCIFKQNQAKFSAGAIYFDDIDGAIMIENTIFDENVALKDHGGSLYADLYYKAKYTHFAINNSTLTNNFAQKDGGGMYMKGYEYHQLFIALHLKNLVFKNNSATLSGGGIYSDFVHLIGVSLRFTENGAGVQGGAVYLEESGIESSVLDHCTCIQNHAPLGFAISIKKFALKVSKSYFIKNFDSKINETAGQKRGGAIYISDLGMFTANNKDTFQEVEILETTFVQNHGRYGGGVFLNKGPRSVKLYNSNFTENMATQQGGAIFVLSSGVLELSSTYLVRNHASMDGGAIALIDSSKLVVHNPTKKKEFKAANFVYYNKAGNRGGGIFADRDSELIVKEKNGIKCFNNTANTGGGIYNSEKFLQEFHYSNFPTGNFAVNGSDIMTYSKVTLVCKSSTYFPLARYDKSVVALDTWNKKDILNTVLCLKCSDGEYSLDGAINCDKCLPGHAGKNGFCTKCPKNMYQPSFGASGCEKCEEGRYSTSVGATICQDAPKPCAPKTPEIYLTDPGSKKPISLYNITISWIVEMNSRDTTECTKSDGYILQISTHRSFTENLYEFTVNNGETMSKSIQLNTFKISDKLHFVRVRGFNKTTLAKSEWALPFEDYQSADKCATEEYLNISSLNPVGNWKCSDCLDGATCDPKYNNDEHAVIVRIQEAANDNKFIMNGLKAKYGYWRSNQNTSYTFIKCKFEAACLGAPNEKLLGKFRNEHDADPAVQDHPEMCNVNAGYRETCLFPVENGKEIKGRCRLCMSCTTETRRGYASPRCKRCPESNIIWVAVAGIIMMLVFAVLLRLGLSMTGRKLHSSHQRRMILSYMQMNTLLATIGIKWPPAIYIMFEIQSAISTVGDHILKIDCIIPNIRPQWLILNMQLGYAISPFIAVIILYICMPCCTFKLHARKVGKLQTRKNTTIKAMVLLLYMSYPSLARQAFLLWHCIGLSGRCVNSGIVYPNINEYACKTEAMVKNGYQWVLDSDHGFGDYLYMATELKCWEGYHALYFYGVGIPHVLLYVLGLPIIGLVILYRLRRNGTMRRPDNLFCYGLLYDGYNDSKWWWQSVVAYVKALVVFVSYWWAETPIMAMLFSNLIFTTLLLAETIAKPWAVSDDTKDRADSIKIRKRRRQSLADMLKNTSREILKETNLAQFSSLSIFLCSLTGWSGLYFSLSPQCNAKSGFLWICMTITISTIVLHILFVMWALYNIFKTKISETRKEKQNIRTAAMENTINIFKTKISETRKEKQNIRTAAMENTINIEMTVSNHRNSVSNIERVEDEIHIHTNKHDEEIEHVVPTYKFTL